MKIRRETRPEDAVAALVLLALVVAISIVYDSCYPCVKWEVQTVQRESCTTIGSSRTCTTRPVQEKVCVERQR